LTRAFVWLRQASVPRQFPLISTLGGVYSLISAGSPKPTFGNRLIAGSRVRTILRSCYTSTLLM